ncbi:MAG: glycosyltransferase family 4 protein [Vicinamibacterales bacterium]
MKARLRVAIVAPTLEILGGHSVQAHALLEGWRDDPDVEAWLVPINPAPAGWLARARRVKYARTVVTQAAYWPLLWRELRRADVVHVFSASYASFLLSPLPALLVSAALGRPALLNYHSGEAPDHLRRSAVARRALARAPHRAVPSRFLAEVFGSFGLDAEVIPNLVDRARFRFRRRDPLGARLLSTRNLEPLYDVACTLRAFRLIQARRPDATLTVVGDGSQAAPLAEHAASLGLRGVRFVGRVPPEDMPRYYDEADIYVQSPRIDNMPLSVLEAFASGLPVVSTDVGGVPAILTHETHGLLVPAGDEQQMADAVLGLLARPDEARRLADRGFESTAALTWPRVREQWLAAYRRLALREAHASAWEPA